MRKKRTDIHDSIKAWPEFVPAKRIGPRASEDFRMKYYSSPSVKITWPPATPF